MLAGRLAAQTARNCSLDIVRGDGRRKVGYSFWGYVHMCVHRMCQHIAHTFLESWANLRLQLFQQQQQQQHHQNQHLYHHRASTTNDTNITTTTTTRVLRMCDCDYQHHGGGLSLGGGGGGGCDDVMVTVALKIVIGKQYKALMVPRMLVRTN